MSRDAADIAWEKQQEEEYRAEQAVGSLERIADAADQVVELLKRSAIGVGWLMSSLLIEKGSILTMGREPNGDLFILHQIPNGPMRHSPYFTEEHPSDQRDVVPALYRLSAAYDKDLHPDGAGKLPF